MAAIEVRACQWSTVPTITALRSSRATSSRKSLYLATSSGLSCPAGLGDFLDEVVDRLVAAAGVDVADGDDPDALLLQRRSW